MLQLRDVSTADLETSDCNKALLLLALGEPNRAYGVLNPFRLAGYGIVSRLIQQLR